MLAMQMVRSDKATYVALGRNVRALRLQKNLTQEELGVKCSPRLSRQAISEIENNGDTTLTTIVVIAQALGVAPAVLLEDSPRSGEALRLAAQIRAMPQNDREVFFRAMADMVEQANRSR
jgi:transcriptional regulator with XRE-family HTH domain